MFLQGRTHLQPLHFSRRRQCLTNLLIPNELQDRVRHLILSNPHFANFANHELLFHIDALRRPVTFRPKIDFEKCQLSWVGQQSFARKCSALALGGSRQA